VRSASGDKSATRPGIGRVDCEMMQVRTRAG
jgi:hypothetical protein